MLEQNKFKFGDLLFDKFMQSETYILASAIEDLKCQKGGGNDSLRWVFLAQAYLNSQIDHVRKTSFTYPACAINCLISMITHYETSTLPIGHGWALIFNRFDIIYNANVDIKEFLSLIIKFYLLKCFN